MTATTSQKQASAKYDRENTKQVILKLNQTTDADILGKLEEVENRQGYIKQLIRGDLRGNDDVLTQDSIRLLIRPVAKKYKIDRIYLFGSYARGEATPESDVDLMIEGGDMNGFGGYLEMVEAFQKALGKETDISEYEAIRQNRSRSGRAFQEHFERDKVLMYEADVYDHGWEK